MKILLFLCFFFLLPLLARAQSGDDFADGDLTDDPAWSGDTAFWQVRDGKLQSRLPEGYPAGKWVFHLSTASAAVQKTSWEFWIQLHFNTSSRNYVDVYLVSDREDPLPDSIHHGYFVRVGSTQDDVSLFRRDSLREVVLADGRDGVTDHGNNTLKIKVTRDGNHRWTLYTDDSGTGSRYFREGTAVDSTYVQGAFFSIVVHQSGKGAAGKHFFDDIRIAPFYPDTVRPFVTAVYPVDAHHVSFLFSEPVDPASAENLLHYTAGGGLAMPDSAAVDPRDPRLVRLYFSGGIAQAKTCHLHLEEVADLSGNECDTTLSFIYYVPRRYDVIMDELLPDPDPSRGLPGHEFAEIKNNAPYPVNLTGWELCDPVRCAVLPRVMLPPDSLLILCDETAAAAFAPYGRTVGLSRFPSLNNAGDMLVLYDDDHRAIHAVSYNKSWYGDEAKDGGGWSLEMEDTRFPCRYAGNWTAGGTPGRKHPVADDPGKTPSLALDYVRVTDSENITAHFNLGLDSAAAVLPGHYSLPGAAVDTAVAGSPLFNTVHLHLSAPLRRRKAYTLEVHGLEGCSGIREGPGRAARFGLPEPADSLDVVINEILFNPRGDGDDFVELYNHSAKVIDVGGLQLANRDGDHEIASSRPVSAVPRYLFPGEYLAVTEDKQGLLQQYACKTPEAILQVPALPPYPNLAGTVVLLDTAGQVIDEVPYDENEQAALFHSDEGVSLERADAAGDSNDPFNWHSAASAAGYATPGYLNSQASGAGIADKAFAVVPRVFSPDHDGLDDVAEISYHLPESGYSGAILVFDAAGRLVRRLARNASLGRHGKIAWDGKNDRKELLPTGIYVVYIRVFNPRGASRQFKLPVVLVKKSR